MKFTILPKEVLVRWYFALKVLFLRMEDRHVKHATNEAFDKVYSAFVVSCRGAPKVKSSSAVMARIRWENQPKSREKIRWKC